MATKAPATYRLERTADRQESFLAHYATLGNVTEAAELIGLTPEAVYLWINEDLQGFKPRFKAAQRSFANYLEKLARKRIEAPSFNGRIGSDVLLLGLLNANDPEKYRPQGVPVDDTARRTLDALRALAQEQRAALAATGPQAPAEDGGAAVGAFLEARRVPAAPSSLPAYEVEEPKTTITVDRGPGDDETPAPRDNGKS